MKNPKDRKKKRKLLDAMRALAVDLVGVAAGLVTIWDALKDSL